MKLFLCHSSNDKQTAQEVYFALGDAKHEVFFDQSSLRPGGDYHSRIRNSIKESDGFIFLISPDSVRKGAYTLTELKFAKDRWPTPSGAVLPVMARETDYDTIDPYLTAVTVLEPSGNIAAEVAAEVYRWSQGSNTIEPTKPRGTVPFMDRLKGILAQVEAAQAQAPPVPAAPPAGVSLAQLFPGAWQVQITYPNGMVGQAMTEVYGNGAFRAQGTSPIARFGLEGTWQMVAANQILMMGQQSDGFRFMPFSVAVTFSQITPTMLVGFMSTGETVVWNRVA